MVTALTSMARSSGNIFASIGCLHSLFRHVAFPIRFEPFFFSVHHIFITLEAFFKNICACQLSPRTIPFFYLHAPHAPSKVFIREYSPPPPLEPLVFLYPLSLRFEPFFFVEGFIPLQYFRCWSERNSSNNFLFYPSSSTSSAPSLSTR